MNDGKILVEVKSNGTGVLTMDRPAKRNSLTPEMIEDLMAAFSEFDASDDIRCIVLTGSSNQAFCAGHDLKSITPDDYGHLYEEAHMQVFLLPRNTRKPVISAVNGAAYAGGLCLALNSDLRIATPEATFAVPAARLGVVPIAGQSARLPHMLPPTIVAEMVMLAKPLSAIRAHQFGFVNEIVPYDDLLSRALEMAGEICSLSTTSIQSFKKIQATSLYQNVPAADAMEYWLAMAAGHGSDLAEGLVAFAEKRKPVFQVKGMS